MTNVALNDEVIRRVDGSTFLDKFRLKVEVNGSAFLDCRDAQGQYCGSCSICIAFDESISRENAHVVELERELDAYTAEVARLEENTVTLLGSLEEQRSQNAVLQHRITTLEESNDDFRAQLEFYVHRVAQLEQPRPELPVTTFVPQVLFYFVVHPNCLFLKLFFL